MILENCVLLNSLEYTSKTTNEKGVRIGYYIADKSYRQDSPVFNGYKELSYFTNDTSIREKIPKDIYGTLVSLVFDKKLNPQNPLRDTSELVGIKTKNGDINLL